MAEKEFWTVGELAHEMNVTVRTLQFYDKEDILKPSARSEGGRRLYSAKDKINLHQILSFKYLGFSLEEIKRNILTLDSPGQVAQVLRRQQMSIQEQISQLQEANDALRALEEEILSIQKVNFRKYAEIIDFLRLGNENYWVWKNFDDELADHVMKHFTDQPDQAESIMETYQKVVEEAIELKNLMEPPDSPKSQELVQKWWNLIMDFTKGDLTLLPKLIEFNDSKDNWKNEEMANRQTEADVFLEPALGLFFERNPNLFPDIWKETQ